MLQEILQPTTVHISDEVIPLIAITLGTLGVGMPVGLFGIASKWARDHRELAPSILVGSTIICVLGVVAAAVLSLALIGWLPPLQQLMQH